MNILNNLRNLLTKEKDQYLIDIYNFHKKELKEFYNLYAIDLEYRAKVRNHDEIRKLWRRRKTFLKLVKDEMKKRNLKWDKD